MYEIPSYDGDLKNGGGGGIAHFLPPASYSSLYKKSNAFYRADNICFTKCHISSFGGLGVACWPFVPKFAGSNPAEAVGFLRAKKSSARLPSERK
jgi:hypothetical protein